MEIKISQDKAAAMIQVDGELEMGLAEKLSSSVDQLLAAKQKKLIIDFTNCDYVDSSGLGALLDISKSCHRKGAELRLTGLNENMRDVFLMTRLDRYFNIVDTTEEAKADLGQA